jgi:hypothetical protein
MGRPSRMGGPVVLYFLGGRQFDLNIEARSVIAPALRYKINSK